MEKVQAIVNKLQQQLQNAAPAEHLLITAQMLVNSLQTVQQQQEHNPYKKVVVTMPTNSFMAQPIDNFWVNDEIVEEKNELPTPQTVATLMAKPLVIEANDLQENEHVFTNKAVEEVIEYSTVSTTIELNVLPTEIDEIPTQTPIPLVNELLQIEEDKTAIGFETENIEPINTLINAAEDACIQEENNSIEAIENIDEVEAITFEETAVLQVEAVHIEAIPEEIATTNFEIEEIALQENDMPETLAITAFEENEIDLIDEHTTEEFIQTDIEKETITLQFGEEDLEEEEVAALAPLQPPVVEKTVHPNFNRESLVAFANAHMANKPVYDTLPTVAYQQQQQQLFELNEVLVTNEPTVNVRYKAARIEVADILENSPIKDLKKAIGVNDKFKFIKELFRDDEAMFERSLKTIQNYSILPEAIFWMDRELKTKLGWEENNDTAKYFYQLVKRRFA